MPPVDKNEEKEPSAQREGSQSREPPQSHPRCAGIISQTLRHAFQRKPEGTNAKRNRRETCQSPEQTIWAEPPELGREGRVPWQPCKHTASEREGKGGERSRRWEGDRRPDTNETRQDTEGKSPRLLHAVRDRAEPCLPPKSNSTGEIVRLQNEPQREISDPRKEIKDKTCLGTNKREAARKLASFPTWLACPFSLRPPDHPPAAALLSSRPLPTSLVL